MSALLADNRGQVRACFAHDFATDEKVWLCPGIPGLIPAVTGIPDSLGVDLLLSLRHRIPALDADPDPNCYGQVSLWPTLWTLPAASLLYGVLVLDRVVRVDVLYAPPPEFYAGLTPEVAWGIDWRWDCVVGEAESADDAALSGLFRGKLGLAGLG